MLNLKLIEIENQYKKPLLQALFSNNKEQLNLIIEKIYLESPNKDTALKAYKTIGDALDRRDDLLDDFNETVEKFLENIEVTKFQSDHKKEISENKQLINAIRQGDLEFVKKNPDFWKTKSWEADPNYRPKFIKNPLDEAAFGQEEILDYLLSNGLSISDVKLFTEEEFDSLEMHFALSFFWNDSSYDLESITKTFDVLKKHGLDANRFMEYVVDYDNNDIDYLEINGTSEYEEKLSWLRELALKENNTEVIQYIDEQLKFIKENF